MRTKKYTVSDGELMLQIQPGDDGWLLVTSPIDPAMITQAKTIPEAFAMARDAFKQLSISRKDPHRWSKAGRSSKGRPARKRAVT